MAMRTSLSALRFGALYAGAVFAVGFMLGALRTLLIAPRTGDLIAVLIELPIILGVSWLVFGALVRRPAPSKALTGLVAFLVLMALELALSAVIAAGGVRGFLASWLTPPGAIGLTGQIAFALIPLVHPAARN
ncbi:hypothetical protein [Hyphobacterium sp.]|uniref:hypothetical protein n=1 Tax=Hyphobacterium sp. TaxID=2004662 RepID=UPI00374A8D08